ncbi:MAG: DUF3098 domain-containing protein [Sphingobacteriales bacterium]|nr:MAG: DUF3098 domain-containing protein [Sphingobacteriales bacterium]
MYNNRRLFGKKNFYIVLVGIGLILLGFALMSGGASTDPNVYPEEVIYGFRRTVLAPVIILLGFIAQIVAIFTPVEETETDSAITTKSTSKTNINKR